MVDRVSHSPSRIPVPSPKSPRLVKNGKYGTDVTHTPPENSNVEIKLDTENNTNGVKTSVDSNEDFQDIEEGVQKPAVPTDLKIGLNDKGKKQKSDKGFETFLMTGDMIIKTNPSQKRKMDGSPLERHHSDSSSYEQCPDERKTFKRSASSPDQTVFIGANPQLDFDDNPKNLPDDMTIESSIDRKPSAESGFEEQATQSDTGTLEKKERLANDPTSISDLSEFESDDLLGNMVSSVSSAVSSSISAVSTPSDLRSDISANTVLQQEVEPLLTEDSTSSSSSIDISSADSESGDLTPEMIFERSMSDSGGMSPINQQDITKYLITSKSAEKIIVQKQVQQKNQDSQVVRASKSQEHYFVDDFTFVAIDIDDTAYSLDQIPVPADRTPEVENKVFPPSPPSPDPQTTNKLSTSCPETKTEKIFMPSFITLEDSEQAGVPNCDSEASEQSSVEVCNDQVNYDAESSLQDVHVAKDIGGGGVSQADSGSGAVVSSEGLCDSGQSEDTVLKQDVLFTPPPAKSVDHPSAKRLAKRLYNLDGFRKSDVSRHLCKKNDFSTLVAEEYLKFFQFAGDSLDVALRKFLKQFSLIGETQERERILAHFSRHFMQSNPGAYNSEDACHTLVCALMLLNTDLHGQSVGRKMTCNEFIENLTELNDGENFPKDVLKALYTAIKAEPIEWAPDEEFQEMGGEEQRTPAPAGPSLPHIAGSNPFVDVPDPSQTTEYKKGYMMRKCCTDADGRKTPVGKRGWKMFFVVLRDMILYVYKDEQAMKKASGDAHNHNAIRVHHCLASKAADYHKKQHVFRLQTADWAEYLFQSSNTKELQEWVDTLNFVAASLSAPPLPGAVGSQKKFQRPLLPVAYTRHNMQEQVASLEGRLDQTELDLQEHRKYAPEKGSKSSHIQHYMEKENYLVFEVGRLKTYIYLLKSRLAACHTEGEASLVETSIGEDEEGYHGNNHPTTPPTTTTTTTPATTAPPPHSTKKTTPSGQTVVDRDPPAPDEPDESAEPVKDVSEEPAQDSSKEPAPDVKEEPVKNGSREPAMYSSTGELIHQRTEITYL